MLEGKKNIMKIIKDKKFGNRNFDLRKRTRNKNIYNEIAKKLRKQGYYVRVTMVSGWYECWISERSFFDRFF